MSRLRQLSPRGLQQHGSAKSNQPSFRPRAPKSAKRKGLAVPFGKSFGFQHECGIVPKFACQPLSRAILYHLQIGQLLEPEAFVQRNCASVAEIRFQAEPFYRAGKPVFQICKECTSQSVRTEFRFDE